jgi:predicted DNA-binding transcriptional regulator YafY
MANNPRLARLIDLVPYISNHQGISISVLADKFGVKKEEIEKDLWLLYMCGLPGQTPLELMEFQFEDGFVTVRNAEELKSPRSLTQTEIAALIVGLQVLESKGSETALKLKEKLTKQLSGAISYQPSPSDLHISEIQQAIQGNNVLRISYLGKMREVIPFEIYQENQSNYLRSYCKVAQDRRTFNVARIETLEVLASTELAPNSVPSESNRFEATIKTHREGRRVRETFRSNETIQYFSAEWLNGEVLALAGAVEVLDPKLRAQISVRAKAGLSLYLQ